MTHDPKPALRPLRVLSTLALALALALAICAPAAPQIIPLTGDFQINQDTSLCPANPTVLARVDGGFTVLWAHQTTSSIQARYYDGDGLPLTNEVVLETGSSIFFDDAAAKPDGSFMAVWSEQDLGGSEIRGRRYASDGTAVGSDFEISSSPGALGFASAAMDDQGEFVVAWIKGTSPDYGVEARVFGADGTPMGGAFPVTSVDNSINPDVAKQIDSGEFAIVWDDGQDIWAERYTSTGVPVGSEFIVNSYTTGSQVQPQVALSASGEMLVSYSGIRPTSAPGQRLAVLAFLDEAGGLVEEEEIGDPATSQARPSLAASPDLGTFAIGMDEVTSGGGEIVLFDLRAAFNSFFDQQVTAAETGAQTDSAVAVDPAGRMTMVWTSDPDEDFCSDLFGVRGQLFRQIGLESLEGGIYSPIAQAGWNFYALTLLDAGDYEVSLTGLTGDVDLYVRLGSLPTAGAFDCRPFLGGVTNESCAVYIDGSELVWIGVNGFQTGAIDFDLSVEPIPPLFVDGFESGNTSAWSVTVN